MELFFELPQHISRGFKGKNLCRWDKIKNEFIVEVRQCISNDIMMTLNVGNTKINVKMKKNVDCRDMDGVIGWFCS